MKKRALLLSPLLTLAGGIEAIKPKPEKQLDEVQSQRNSIWAEFQQMHEDMLSMFKRMDTVFENTSKEFFNDDLFEGNAHHTFTLEEKDSNLIARIKLSNIDQDSINVCVDDTGFGSSTLTISASQQIQKEVEGKKQVMQSNFFESRTLPYQVNAQTTTAEYSQQDGMLTITMPREKLKNSITVVKK